jgi:hypothetical protein
MTTETIFRQEARDVLSAEEKAMVNQIIREGVVKYNAEHTPTPRPTVVKSDSDEAAKAIAAIDQAFGGPPLENAQAIGAAKRAGLDPAKMTASEGEPNAQAARLAFEQKRRSACVILTPAERARRTRGRR